MQIDKWSVLAGLRFVLAFIVAVNHLPDFVPVGIWALVPKFGAFEAVLGFLLISGFSIGTSYQKEPKAFLRRRTLRIYPIYIAALALTCVVFAMEHGTMPSAWLLVANVLFLNQIVTSDSFVGPAWSLALEFWLYLLTPLLFSLKPSTLQLLARVSFVAFLAHTCGRTLFHWNYYSGVGYGLNLVFLSFIWLAGFRLAREPQRYQPILNEVGWMFALHILLAISIQFASSWKRDQVDQFLHVGIDSFALQAFTLLAVLWTFKRIAKSVGAQSSGSAALRLLGDISYPLYIIHIPAFYFLKPRWPGQIPPPLATPNSPRQDDQIMTTRV
ncbi:Acyltransferase family protein (plasmid) [Variovorax sp. PBL-H6]|uniref:acyltransferase family protein n=1 Tax=Variovorax sp. PBL-H6 TaxID=434009 RepID=UPI0013189F48|nr:acyltransferase [Variovorax sp. PBL-H6]VTU43924.1 Acyltransferase family protein [Variovorax sp. PBL-H6]